MSQLGMIGLGRMGANMAERLRRGGHDVQSYDPAADSTAASLAELRDLLSPPRIFWMMVPAGAITETTFEQLISLGARGDTIVDGGNTNFRDSQRRQRAAAEVGIGFADAGVSGGVWGLEGGYCLMVGGEDAVVSPLTPIFTTLAPPEGYAHVGPPGAGHFTKMIHNGIEYGLMQAYAEGFEVLEHSEFELDLHQIAALWRHGSVVRSWLLDLLEKAFEQEGGKLEAIQGYVEDSGEGRWTVAEAIAEDVPVPVITAALYARLASRQDESFAAKVNAALRNQFGGHPVRPADEGAEK